MKSKGFPLGKDLVCEGSPVLTWWQLCQWVWQGPEGATCLHAVGHLEGLLLLFLPLLPLCPTMPVQDPCFGPERRRGPQVWEVGRKDSRGCSVGSTPCLSCHLVTVSYSCGPQTTSQGQRQRQELLSFLFNGHWKNSGLLSSNSLLPPLYLGT